jgi:hypothetical protein
VRGPAFTSDSGAAVPAGQTAQRCISPLLLRLSDDLIL